MLAKKRTASMNGLERTVRSVLSTRNPNESMDEIARRIHEARIIREQASKIEKKANTKKILLGICKTALFCSVAALAIFLYKRDHPKTFVGKVKRGWKNRNGREDRKSAMYEFLLQGGFTMAEGAVTNNQISDARNAVDRHIRSINRSKKDIKNILYPAIIYLVRSLRKIGRTRISRYKLEYEIALPIHEQYLQNVMKSFIFKQIHTLTNDCKNPRKYNFLPALRMNRWPVAEAAVRSSIQYGKFKVIESSLAGMDKFFQENVEILEMIVRRLIMIKEKGGYLDDEQLAFISKQMKLCTHFTNVEIYRGIRKIKTIQTEERLIQIIEGVTSKIPDVYKVAINIVEYDRMMNLVIDERMELVEHQ